MKKVAADQKSAGHWWNWRRLDPKAQIKKQIAFTLIRRANNDCTRSGDECTVNGSSAMINPTSTVTLVTSIPAVGGAHFASRATADRARLDAKAEERLRGRGAPHVGQRVLCAKGEAAAVMHSR